MGKSKVTDKYPKGFRATTALRCCWWKYEMVEPLWETVLHVFIKLNIHLPWLSNSTINYPEKNEYIPTKTFTWMFIAAFNSLTTQTRNDSNYNQLVNREDKFWYIHLVKYLLSSKKEYTINPCINMDEYQNHCAKWEKPNSKVYILYDYIHMKICNWQN